MYTCPNCGGDLTFHVEKQKMVCENCRYEEDPCKVQEFHSAEEEQTDEYEATVFRCPHCGGEIISEDTTAATFCSFCGATTVLESRIVKERKPAYILPFQKTKEECREAYGKVLKKALFVPDEYKNPENINKFRGIYMPYWDYQYSLNEPFYFTGTKTRRRGNYLYTDFYNVSCNVDMNYRGVYFDASSSFADHMSERISPYAVKDGKEFTPAYLSGFYADTSDVGKEVYEQKADEQVTEDLSRKISKDHTISKYSVTSYEIDALKNRSSSQAKLVMLPVWFLSCRNGDRVSYAAVNGQTGKVSAELPVDRKKYFTASMILSALIFLLLNWKVTLTPSTLLPLAVILSIVCIVIINVQMTRLIARDTGQDDMGYVSVKLGSKKPARKETDRWTEAGGSFLSIFLFVMAFNLFGPFLLSLLGSSFMGVLVMMVPIYFFIRQITGAGNREVVHKNYFGNWKEKIPVLFKPVLGIIAVAAVAVIHPVRDVWYYLSVLFSLLMTAFSFSDIIKYHNKLTTRKLPQFNRRGGDENE